MDTNGTGLIQLPAHHPCNTNCYSRMFVDGTEARTQMTIGGSSGYRGRKMLNSWVWMNLCSFSLTQLQVLSVQCTWLCNTLETETNDTPDEKNG